MPNMAFSAERKKQRPLKSGVILPNKELILMESLKSDNIELLIGKTGFYYFNSIIELRDSQDDWHYPIMSEMEFKKMDCIFKQHRVYWTEMLYRCHIAVLVSIFRSTRWLDSISSSIISKSFYSFSSCLRGFIEALADSFYTLRNIPLTIAKDFQAIYQALKTESVVIIDHDVLEKTLIHFTHASKKPKGEKKSKEREHFYAKQTREYLQSIEGGNEKILDLYSYLCEVTHPSYYSNTTVFFARDDEMIVCGDSLEYELSLIHSLLDVMSETIETAYRIHCTNTFQILNLLNLFDIKEIFTKFNFIENFKNIDSWFEIEKYIKESKSRYQNAIDTGKYN